MSSPIKTHRRKIYSMSAPPDVTMLLKRAQQAGFGQNGNRILIRACRIALKRFADKQILNLQAEMKAAFLE